MRLLVKADNHIQGSAELTRHVETLVYNALRRFGDRITRAAVHFSDDFKNLVLQEIYDDGCNRYVKTFLDSQRPFARGARTDG